MKLKNNHIVLKIIGGIIILIILYTTLMPYLILPKLMEVNYSLKREKFNELRKFLRENDSLLFPEGNSALVENIKKNNPVIELEDSLQILLNNVSCTQIFKAGGFHDTSSVKLYVLIYHKEFLFPEYAYKLTSGKRSIQKAITSDGFYDYKWLDSLTIAGSLSWN